MKPGSHDPKSHFSERTINSGNFDDEKVFKLELLAEKDRMDLDASHLNEGTINIGNSDDEKVLNLIFYGFGYPIGMLIDIRGEKEEKESKYIMLT